MTVETTKRVEQAVLASCLCSPAEIELAISRGVTDAAFYDLRCQIVWRAVVALHDELDPVDIVSVQDRLMAWGKLADAGGPEFVMGLFDIVPTSANLGYYINRLFQLADERARLAAVEQAGRFIAEGHVELAAALLEKRVRPPASVRRLPSETFAQASPDLSRSMLVDDWIPHESFGVLYGPSGSGKSFFAIDLAMHVAAGLPWNGKDVARRAVVYVAAEAPASARARFAALRSFYPNLERAGPLPLHLIPEPVDLVSGDADVDALVAKVDELSRSEPVGLVIVDTLARAMAGADENDFREMGAVVARLEQVVARTKASVVAVHHTGKDSSRGARGHSSLKGAADVMIEVSRDVDDDTLRYAQLEKSRDGEDGERIAFTLIEVPLGAYPNGRPATSAVVQTLSQEEALKPPRGRDKVALDLLASMYDRGAAAVTEDEWRAAFVHQVSAELSPKAARDTHRRAVKKLRRFLDNRDGIVTLRYVQSGTKTEKARVNPRSCSSDVARTQKTGSFQDQEEPPEPNEPSYIEKCSSVVARTDDPVVEPISENDVSSWTKACRRGADTPRATTELQRRNQPPEPMRHRATTELQQLHVAHPRAELHNPPPLGGVVAARAAPTVAQENSKAKSSFEAEEDAEADARMRSLRPKPTSKTESDSAFDALGERLGRDRGGAA